MTPRALGKAAPAYDERTAKLSQYVDMAVISAPPTTENRSSAITDWGLWRNDRVGDCGVVGQGNAEKFWSSRENNASEAEFTDDNIIAAYSDISGYDPISGRNDNGVILLKALRHWRHTGLSDASGVVHHIAHFAAVDLRNPQLARAACWLFDGLYIGLNLPQTAQTQIEAGRPWVVDSTAGSQAYPGSWGGHCVFVPDYDTIGWDCITWGKKQTMTNDFFHTYCDEAYAIIAPDYMHSGSSVEGFNAHALAADLRRVRA